MFSKECGYAMRILVFIESNASLAVPCKPTEIAETTEIPKTTVERLLRKLSKNGLLAYKRGKEGGYYPAKDKAIRLIDIMDVTDGENDRLFRRSLWHEADHPHGSFHKSYHQVLQKVEQLATDTTLKDLAKGEIDLPKKDND